jgi:hypothetical protein
MGHAIKDPNVTCGLYPDVKISALLSIIAHYPFVAFRERYAYQEKVP